MVPYQEAPESVTRPGKGNLTLHLQLNSHQIKSTWVTIFAPVSSKSSGTPPALNFWKRRKSTLCGKHRSETSTAFTNKKEASCWREYAPAVNDQLDAHLAIEKLRRGNWRPVFVKRGSETEFLEMMSI